MSTQVSLRDVRFTLPMLILFQLIGFSVGGIARRLVGDLCLRSGDTEGLTIFQLVAPASMSMFRFLADLRYLMACVESGQMCLSSAPYTTPYIPKIMPVSGGGKDLVGSGSSLTLFSRPPSGVSRFDHVAKAEWYSARPPRYRAGLLVPRTEVCFFCFCSKAVLIEVQHVHMGTTHNVLNFVKYNLFQVCWIAPDNVVSCSP